MKIADQSFPRQKILLITYTIQSCYNHENKNQKYSQSLQSTILRIFHENSHKSQRLFLIDRLETIVNELFHYNNFLVDQLENWESIYIIPLCYNHEKQSQKTSLKSFPHLPIGKGVNRLYIYPIRRKDSTTLFLTRTTAHFPRGSIGKCFRKATNVSSILTETTISQQWDTNWKFLESGQSFSALRNFDRQRAPPLWRKLLRDIGSRRRFIWLQVKKKKFPRQGFDTSSLDSAIFSSLRWRIGNLPASKPAALDVSLIESWNNVKLQIVPRLEKQSSRWNLLLTWSQTFLD